MRTFARKYSTAEIVKNISYGQLMCCFCQEENFAVIEFFLEVNRVGHVWSCSVLNTGRRVCVSQHNNAALNVEKRWVWSPSLPSQRLVFSTFDAQIELKVRSVGFCGGTRKTK